MRKGFTLIELMIVVAIIAIIAAIAIPNLVTGRIAANEASAIAGLKMLVSQNAIWRQTDVDGNGIKDFWNRDVSCFHRFLRADGSTKVGFVDVSFAKADIDAFSRDISECITTNPNRDDVEPWAVTDQAFTTTPKSGYFFRALQLYNTAGPSATAVNEDLRTTVVGTNSVAIGHETLMGFVGVPQVYGQSGANMFIVDQGGVVYSTDLGANNNPRTSPVPWYTVTSGSSLALHCKWPAVPPQAAQTVLTGPGGRVWAPAE